MKEIRGFSLRVLTVIHLLLVTATAFCSEVTVSERWAETFEKYDANGTLVLLDARDGREDWLYHDAKRAETRFSPASTYKIPHALIALELDVAKDEFEIFKWDGVERTFSGHNSDQNLRSAMRNSTLWVFQDFAEEISSKEVENLLMKFGYGNADTYSKEGVYWVYGNLSISAKEQIRFLEKLYRNELPIGLAHQRLVKDLIIVEAKKNWILRGKTGWTGQLGWWVGWVEHASGPVFFALNIDTPNRMSDLSKREQIVRDVLLSLDLIP